MKTLAILSRKGGTGKTTLATHLSVAAESAGHTTALIDSRSAVFRCKMARQSRWRYTRSHFDTLGTLITDPETCRGERRNVRDSGYRPAYRDRGS